MIYFINATHPQHNPVIGCAWIKRGKEHPIQSTTGRQRLNITGAVNVHSRSAGVRFDETIDAATMIALFKQLANPTAPFIVVICDNSHYYESKAVAAYLATSQIQLEPFAPYCPNLNLIERFWKFFKLQVLYNQYYDTFEKFRGACKSFFGELDAFALLLRTLLAENFQIIGNEKPKIAIA